MPTYFVKSNAAGGGDGSALDPFTWDEACIALDGGLTSATIEVHGGSFTATRTMNITAATNQVVFNPLYSATVTAQATINSILNISSPLASFIANAEFNDGNYVTSDALLVNQASAQTTCFNCKFIRQTSNTLINGFGVSNYAGAQVCYSLCEFEGGYFGSSGSGYFDRCVFRDCYGGVRFTESNDFHALRNCAVYGNTKGVLLQSGGAIHNSIVYGNTTSSIELANAGSWQETDGRILSDIICDDFSIAGLSLANSLSRDGSNNWRHLDIVDNGVVFTGTLFNDSANGDFRFNQTTTVPLSVRNLATPVIAGLAGIPSIQVDAVVAGSTAGSGFPVSRLVN